MMRTVRLSEQATQFIDRESDYLFDRSPTAASTFVKRISDACQNLSQFPNLGLRTDGFPLRGSMRLITGDYVLNYDLDHAGVVITAIRHNRQLPIDLPIDDDLDP